VNADCANVGDDARRKILAVNPESAPAKIVKVVPPDCSVNCFCTTEIVNGTLADTLCARRLVSKTKRLSENRAVMCFTCKEA